MLLFSCLVLLVLLTGFAIGLKESQPLSHIMEFTSGWQWNAPGDPSLWAPWEPGRLDKKKGATTIVLRKKIPAKIPHNTALFLPPYSTFQSFEAFLDNKSIYASGKPKPTFSNRHLYLKWHLIPLPPGSGEKYLTLRFHSTHHRHIGIISKAFLGTPRALINTLVLRDLDITVLAVLFIIVGLAAGITSIADCEPKNRPTSLFAIMAFFAGIYVLTECRITQLLVDVTPLFSYLHYTSFFIFMIGMSAFIEKSIGSGYWGCLRRMRQILLVLTAAGTILDLLSVVPWDITFGFGMWLLLALIVPLGVELIRTALAGRYEARIMCLGFTMVLFLGLIDLMGGLSIISFKNQTIFPWGILLVFFCFLWVLIYNHRTDREKNDRDLQQSHERFRRLFEDAPVPIFQFDIHHSDYLLLRVNSQAQSLFGYEKAELNLVHLKKLLAHDENHIFALLGEQLLCGDKFIAEGTGLHKNGTPFPVRITASMEQFPGSHQAILILEDLTLEKARRSEEEAIVEERNRIAREIHDGLAQDLATMSMKASVWEHITRNTPDKMLDEIDFLRKLIAKNIKDVRRCILALRPLDLDKFGFKESVRRLTNDFEKQHHIHMNYESAGLVRVPQHLELALFRIIQESLNNVAKHAEAKAVYIRLQITEANRIILKIKDDGKGFVPSGPDELHRSGHLGLKQMEERVKQANGIFQIKSNPEQGTSLSITVPLI